MKRTQAIKKIHAILQQLPEKRQVQVLQAVAALHQGFYVEESS